MTQMLVAAREWSEILLIAKTWDAVEGQKMFFLEIRCLGENPLTGSKSVREADDAISGL